MKPGEKWLDLQTLKLALSDVEAGSCFSYAGYDAEFVREMYRQGFVEDHRDWPLLTEKGKEQLAALRNVYLHQNTD